MVKRSSSISFSRVLVASICLSSLGCGGSSSLDFWPHAEGLLPQGTSSQRLCFSSTWFPPLRPSPEAMCCQQRLVQGRPKRATMLLNVRCRLDVDTDHYAVLGVSRSADDKTLKTAYRQLSRKHHPDVSEDDSDADSFYRINVAYEILSNPDMRKRYDVARGHPAHDSFVRELETMASKFHGAEEHSCSTCCSDPNEANKQSRSAPGKMMRKMRYTSAVEDRIKTSPFEAILEMEEQARRAASDDGVHGGMACCTLCGATQVLPGEICAFCGGQEANPQQQRTSVTGVYTMHKTARRLDSEERHNLVHKNHFERPSHTRRLFDEEHDTLASQLENVAVPPPSSSASPSAPLSPSSSPLSSKFSPNYGSPSAGGSESASSDSSATARRSERMFLCPTCGCHTTSLLRCDACGAGGGDEMRAGGFVGGMTRVHAMHTRSGRGSRLDAESMHCLVHPRHVAEHARGDGERRAPHGKGSETTHWFGTLRELNQYLEDEGKKAEPLPAVEAVTAAPEEEEERTETAWEEEVKRELVRARADRLPRPPVRTQRSREERGGAGRIGSARQLAETSAAVTWLPSFEETFLSLSSACEEEEVEEVRAKVDELRYFVSHLEGYAAAVRAEAAEAEAEAEAMAMAVRQREGEGDVRGGEEGGGTEALVRCELCGCDSLRTDRCDCCGAALGGTQPGQQAPSPSHGHAHGHDHDHDHEHEHEEERGPGLAVVSGPGVRCKDGKQACKACLELEGLLQVRAEAGRQAAERRQAAEARARAERRRRESEALDVVVARHSARLLAAERRLLLQLECAAGAREEECYSDVDGNCLADP